MRILLTNKLSDALLETEKTFLDGVISEIDNLESMNKKEIIGSPKTIFLKNTEGTDVYAYHLFESFFVMFFFKKKSVLLIDVFELKNKALKSLSFPEITA